ncbi:MAG: sporulation protein YqfC [Clostridiales bacterium]|nr:sporulation protein YqfC [Clostridiales bacterium]
MNSLKRRIIQALELPADIMLDLPVVTVTGDEELVLTNHRGLLEYGAGHVRLGCSRGQIKIFGTNLILKEITAESIVIAGKIDKVLWEGS